jgi:hypothetical protein
MGRPSLKRRVGDTTSERSALRVPAQDGAPARLNPAGQFPSNRIAAEDEPLNCRGIGGRRHRRAARRRDNDAVRSGFCQGVARDSVLSFGRSVRCGTARTPEPLASVGAVVDGRRRRCTYGRSRAAGPRC